MFMKNFCVICIFLLIGVSYIQSQTNYVETKVGFRINRIHIDSKFKDNKQQIKVLDSVLNKISQDSTIEVVSVSFRGAA